MLQNIINKSILESQTASNSSSLPFNNIPVQSQTLLIAFQNVTGSATASNLLLRFSTNRGSTFISSGYNAGINFSLYNSSIINNQNTTSGFILAPSAGTVAATFSGFEYIYNYNSSINYPVGNGLGSVSVAGSSFSGITNNTLTSTTNVNALSISFSSGNIVTGTFKVFLIA